MVGGLPAGGLYKVHDIRSAPKRMTTKYLPDTDVRPGSNKHTGSEPVVPYHTYSLPHVHSYSAGYSAGHTLLIAAATAAARRQQSLPNPSERPLQKNPSSKKRTK